MFKIMDMVITLIWLLCYVYMSQNITFYTIIMYKYVSIISKNIGKTKEMCTEKKGFMWCVF